MDGHLYDSAYTTAMVAFPPAPFSSKCVCEQGNTYKMYIQTKSACIVTK